MRTDLPKWANESLTEANLDTENWYSSQTPSAVFNTTIIPRHMVRVDFCNGCYTIIAHPLGAHRIEHKFQLVMFRGDRAFKLIDSIAQQLKEK